MYACICMCMHAYMCVHTRMGIYQHVHDCACVHVYVHAYVRVCTFCNTLPHIEVGLAGFAPPPPNIEKLPTPMLHVFHREKLHF